MSEHNEQARAPAQMNMDMYRRPGGAGGLGRGRVFCCVAHPDNPSPDVDPDGEFVFCRRLVGHEGDHAAFAFSISVPESWPNDNTTV